MSIHSELRIGSIVRLPGGEKGLLKYVGPVQGKSGEFAGVEMLQGYEDHGKHSGSFDGVSYFTTSKPNTGVFLSYSRLIGTNIKSSPVSRRTSLMSTSRNDVSPLKRSISSPKKSVLSETPRRASRLPPTPCRRPTDVFPSSEGLRPNSRTAVRRPALRTASASSTSSLQDEVRSLTTQLASAQEQLSVKDAQLEEQLAMIRDMEVSLNEVQEIVQTHQQDPDVDVEVMRQAITSKDNKLMTMKQEFEQKRLEFRQYIESLEDAIRQRDEEYDKTFREYDQNDNMKQLRHTIAELTGKLAVSEDGEKSLRVQLSRLAGVENKLLDKEQEIKDFREQMELYKNQLDNGEVSGNLPEALEIERRRISSLESMLAEKQQQIDELMEKNERKYEDNEQIEILSKQLDVSRDEVALLKKVQTKLENTIAEKQTEIDGFSKAQENFKKEIRDLRRELQEKQKENDTRHEYAFTEKQLQLKDAQSEIEKLTAQLKAEKAKNVELTKQHDDLESMVESNVLKESDNLRSISCSTAVSSTTGPRTPPSTSLGLDPVDGESDLPIYKSPKKVDPTAGRQLWCGLCERLGHESVDCPYEEF